MTQKEIDHIRKRERWREIIAKQKASGLSIVSFCLREDIRPGTFQYWKTAIVKETLGDATMLGVLKATPLVNGAKETVQTVEEVAFQPVEGTLPNMTLPCDEARLCQIVEYAITKGELSSNRMGSIFNMSGWTAAKIIAWLERKGIVKRHASCHPCEVLITRDQWEAMKDQLLTTDKTVADLLPKSEEPAARETVPAPETEPAPVNTFFETLHKHYPKPPPEK